MKRKSNGWVYEPGGIVEGLDTVVIKEKKDNKKSQLKNKLKWQSIKENY